MASYRASVACRRVIDDDRQAGQVREVSRRSTERLSPLREQQGVADVQQPEARHCGTVADDIAEDAARFIRPILFDQSGNRH